jgi:hypothetical protein
MCSEFSRQRSHEADLRFVGQPYLTGGGPSSFSRLHGRKSIKIPM